MKSSTVKSIAVLVIIGGIILGVYNWYNSFTLRSLSFDSGAFWGTVAIAGVIAFILFLWAGLLKNQETQINNQNTNNATNMPPQQNNENTFCAKCGRKLSAGASFCTKCGNAVSK